MDTIIDADQAAFALWNEYVSDLNGAPDAPADFDDDELDFDDDFDVDLYLA